MSVQQAAQSDALAFNSFRNSMASEANQRILTDKEAFGAFKIATSVDNTDAAERAKLAAKLPSSPNGENCYQSTSREHRKASFAIDRQSRTTAANKRTSSNPPPSAHQTANLSSPYNAKHVAIRTEHVQQEPARERSAPKTAAKEMNACVKAKQGGPVVTPLTMYNNMLENSSITPDATVQIAHLPFSETVENERTRSGALESKTSIKVDRSVENLTEYKKHLKQLSTSCAAQQDSKQSVVSKANKKQARESTLVATDKRNKVIDQLQKAILT